MKIRMEIRGRESISITVYFELKTVPLLPKFIFKKCLKIRTNVRFDKFLSDYLYYQ